MWFAVEVTLEARSDSPRLVRRCAWCGSVWTGRSWDDAARRAADAPVTHTICPDCVDSLRRSGRSR